jgi:hypothetical protein
MDPVHCFEGTDRPDQISSRVAPLHTGLGYDIPFFIDFLFLNFEVDFLNEVQNFIALHAHLSNHQ